MKTPLSVRFTDMLNQALSKDDFDESKHPRDEAGRFAEGSGGAGTSAENHQRLTAEYAAVRGELRAVAEKVTSPRTVRGREYSPKAYAPNPIELFDPNLGKPRWQTAWSGSGYKRSRELAQSIVEQRFSDLLKKQFPDIDEERAERTIENMTTEVWKDWKRSSSEHGGLLIQHAASLELGAGARPMDKDQLEDLDQEITHAGHESMTWDEASKVSPDGWKGTDEEKKRLKDVERVRGEKVVRAYVRAQWETVQYLAEQTKMEELTVYRAVFLPMKDLSALSREGKETKPESGWKKATFTQLHGVKLWKNGVSSWTTDANVANKWKGVGDVDYRMPEDTVRVVLRAKIPRSAVLSVPVFGKNYAKESEVIVAGTGVSRLEAFADKAPEVEEVGWGDHSEPVEERGGFVTKIRASRVEIDLNNPKVTGGKKHWLSRRGDDLED